MALFDRKVNNQGIISSALNASTRAGLAAAESEGKAISGLGSSLTDAINTADKLREEDAQSKFLLGSQNLRSPELIRNDQELATQLYEKANKGVDTGLLTQSEYNDEINRLNQMADTGTKANAFDTRESLLSSSGVQDPEFIQKQQLLALVEKQRGEDIARQDKRFDISQANLDRNFKFQQDKWGHTLDKEEFDKLSKEKKAKYLVDLMNARKDEDAGVKTLLGSKPELVGKDIIADRYIHDETKGYDTVNEGDVIGQGYADSLNAQEQFDKDLPKLLEARDKAFNEKNKSLLSNSGIKDPEFLAQRQLLNQKERQRVSKERTDSIKQKHKVESDKAILGLKEREVEIKENAQKILTKDKLDKETKKKAVNDVYKQILTPPSINKETGKKVSRKQYIKNREAILSQSNVEKGSDYNSLLSNIHKSADREYGKDLSYEQVIKLDKEKADLNSKKIEVKQFIKDRKLGAYKDDDGKQVKAKFKLTGDTTADWNRMNNYIKKADKNKKTYKSYKTVAKDISSSITVQDDTTPKAVDRLGTDEFKEAYKNANKKGMSHDAIMLWLKEELKDQESWGSNLSGSPLGDTVDNFIGLHK